MRYARILWLQRGSEPIMYYYEGQMYFGLFGEYGEAELKKYSDICVIPDKGMHLLLKIRKEDICKEEPRPMKMRLKIGSALWCEEENPVRTLGKANVSPGDYGWLLCDD